MFNKCVQCISFLITFTKLIENNFQLLLSIVYILAYQLANFFFPAFAVILLRINMACFTRTK